MRFLFLTRSAWSEPHRLRQQLALLLASKEHEVIFVEKPRLFSAVRRIETDHSRIAAFSCRELIHHQLRPFAFLNRVNNLVVARSVSDIVGALTPDAVVNFNYDYHLTREQFRSQPFVTVLNEDFVAEARPWMKTSARTAISNVCKVSDATLCVSYPIRDQATRLGGKCVKLFLPWCDVPYSAPKSVSRRVILYFGYINRRIDWKVVHELAQMGFSLRFVGPVTDSSGQVNIDRLAALSNVEYHRSRPIAEVQLDDVCCSVLPYVQDDANIIACTASNRVFQLLARGIPLVYCKLPHLLSAPSNVITVANSSEEFADAFRFFMSEFDGCQKAIANFLVGHSANERYEQFMSAVSRRQSISVQ